MGDQDWIAESLRAAESVFGRVAGECSSEIQQAADAVVRCLRARGKVLLCGNGGSAADAQHIAAELTVKMKHIRAPLAAVALTTNSSLLTAQANDLGFETVFARQIESLGNPGDVLLAISTSGNSANILRAAESARRMGILAVALTGCGGGNLARLCDISIVVPSHDVPRVQEAHIAIGHLICEYAERSVFGT